MMPIEQVQQLKREMMTGAISREEAFKRAEPFVAQINQSATEVAKRYGRRHKAWPVIKFLRT